MVNFELSGGATVRGRVTNLIAGGNNGIAVFEGRVEWQDPDTLTTE